MPNAVCKTISLPTPHLKAKQSISVVFERGANGLMSARGRIATNSSSPDQLQKGTKAVYVQQTNGGPTPRWIMGEFEWDNYQDRFNRMGDESLAEYDERRGTLYVLIQNKLVAVHDAQDDRAVRDGAGLLALQTAMNTSTPESVPPRVGFSSGAGASAVAMPPVQSDISSLSATSNDDGYMNFDGGRQASQLRNMSGISNAPRTPEGQSIPNQDGLTVGRLRNAVHNQASEGMQGMIDAYKAQCDDLRRTNKDLFAKVDQLEKANRQHAADLKKTNRQNSVLRSIFNVDKIRASEKGTVEDMLKCFEGL